jgi:hypothetical protein
MCALLPEESPGHFPNSIRGPFPGISPLVAGNWVYVTGANHELKVRMAESDADSTAAASELSVHGIQPRVGRNFELPNYREIAKVVGVFMITTAAGMKICI